MSHVAIEKVDGKEAGKYTIFGELKAISERIRERAFDLFERRGGQDGMATDDWMNAERDLFRFPESELVEKDGRFEVNMSAPGFNPGDLTVTALPDGLIVQASSTHQHDKREGKVRFCEFSQKALFRRFELPESINVDKVTANLEKGMLHLTAFKARGEAAPKHLATTA